MSHITDIYTKLTDIFNNIPDIPKKIQADNEHFEPDLRETWFRFNFQPNQTDVSSLGENGLNTAGGLFAIDCFVRSGSGVTEINQLTDKIVAYYEENQLSLTPNDHGLRINKVYAVTPNVESDWYRRTILVDWASEYYRGN